MGYGTASFLHTPCWPTEFATKSFQRHLPPLVDLERHSYFAYPLPLVCRSISNQSFHAQRWLTASMTVYRHRPLAHRAIKSVVSCSVGQSLRLRIRTPICTSFLQLPCRPTEFGMKRFQRPPPPLVDLQMHSYFAGSLPVVYADRYQISRFMHKHGRLLR